MLVSLALLAMFTYKVVIPLRGHRRLGILPGAAAQRPVTLLEQVRV